MEAQLCFRVFMEFPNFSLSSLLSMLNETGKKVVRSMDQNFKTYKTR